MLLGLILCLAAGDARAEHRLDPDIAQGIEYLRGSSEDGRAMAEYISIDPLVIRFGQLPPGVLGLYHGDGWMQNRAEVILRDSLRALGPRTIGEVLYHEYLHRLQEKSGGIRGHSQLEALSAAEFMCRKVRCSPGTLQSPAAAARRSHFGTGRTFMPVGELALMRDYEARHHRGGRRTLDANAWFTPWRVDTATVDFAVRRGR